MRTDSPPIAQELGPRHVLKAGLHDEAQVLRQHGTQTHRHMLHDRNYALLHDEAQVLRQHVVPGHGDMLRQQVLQGGRSVRERELRGVSL